jgi:hypothetical protein
MQSLCTLRDHCRQWPRNTRYQADATPYLGRTSTGWIAPACGWRTHSFPDSGNDVPRGVGNMIKWIKERDPKVQFGLIENKSRQAIIDFLLSPGVSDDVTLSCLRHTRALDGKG